MLYPKACVRYDGKDERFLPRDDAVFFVNDKELKTFLLQKVEKNPKILNIELKKDTDFGDAKYCGGVIFQKPPANGDRDFHYDLYKQMPESGLSQISLPVTSTHDFDIGSVKMQQYVDEYLLSIYGISSEKLPSFYAAPLPELSNTGAELRVTTWGYTYLLPNYIVMAFLFCAATSLAKRILKDKEFGTRDAMIAQGVLFSATYCSYAVIMLVWSFSLSVMPVVIFYVVKISLGNAIIRMNPLVVFLIMWLTCWNMMAFAGLLSLGFKTAKLGTNVIQMSFLLMLVVAFVLMERFGNPHLIRLFSLLAPINICETFQTMHKLDTMLIPDDVSFAASKLPVMGGIMMNAVGIVLWQVLRFSLDLFLMEGSAFTLSTLFQRNAPDEDEAVKTKGTEFIQPPTALEKDAEKANRVVELINASKKFGSFFAVDHIDMKIYSGEIFALLGHNGAGKTTTFNMLSGMQKHTGGSIRVFGRSLQDYQKTNRSKVGLCTQKNFVWPDLTVYEHLRLFCTFKNLNAKETLSEFDGLLSLLSLSDKKDVLASKLSGGMTRKLCLAISLLGNPELPLLDEPTSGLDPTARRDLWDMLLSLKQDRVIILSTHYMEEADALGQRVAIMHHGQIACNGSPNFLKEKYGCGYNLTILMKTDNEGEARDVRELTVKHCPNVPVQVLSNIGREVSIILPFSASQHFEELFAAFEVSPHIESFTVGVSNLEEVFLKVAAAKQAGSETDAEKDEPLDAMKGIIRDAGNLSNVGGLASTTSSKLTLFVFQLRACVVKRLFFSLRSWQADIGIILLPVLFIGIALLMKLQSAPSSQSNLQTYPLTFPPPSPPFLPAAKIQVMHGKRESMGASYSELLKTLGNRKDVDVKDLSKVPPTECAIFQTDDSISSSDEYDFLNKPAEKDEKCRILTDVFNSQDFYKTISLLSGRAVTPNHQMRYMGILVADDEVKLFSNLYFRDGPMMTQNYYTNALLKSQGKKVKITASSVEVPVNKSLAKQARTAALHLVDKTYTVLALLVMSLLQITKILMGRYYTERDLGILSQHQSIGLKMVPYWIAHGIFDVGMQWLGLLLVLVVMHFTVAIQWQFTAAVFVLYPIASTGYVQFLCTAFEKSVLATVFVYSMTLAPVILAPVIVMMIPGLAEKILKIYYYFEITPLLGVCGCLYEVMAFSLKAKPNATTIWDEDDFPKSILVLLVQVVLWPVASSRKRAEGYTVVQVAVDA